MTTATHLYPTSLATLAMSTDHEFAVLPAVGGEFVVVNKFSKDGDYTAFTLHPHPTLPCTLKAVPQEKHMKMWNQERG